MVPSILPRCYRVVLLACLAASALVGQGEVRADAPSVGVVVELHRGERPERADAVLGAVTDELHRLGFAVRQAASERIHERHSLPAGELSADELAKARQDITAARSAYLDLEFAEAITRGRQGRELLMSHPATLARRQELRDLHYDALVTLAMAHNRLRQSEELDAVMDEYLRCFPDRELSRKRYGPEGVKLYKAALQRHSKMPKAQLTLDGSADTMLFVNERFVGVGEQRLSLSPGRYRIYAMQGATGSRVRFVDLQADGDARVTREELRPRAGLHTETDLPMARISASGDAPIAELVAIASTLEVSTLVVLSLFDRGEQLSATAEVYALPEGTFLRAAALDFGDGALPSTEQLKALGRFAADGSHDGTTLRLLDESAHADGSKPLLSAAATPRADAGAGPHPAWRWSSWVLGAASLGAGAYLYSIDGDGTCDLQAGQLECPETYETRDLGVGLAIGGGALLTTGLLLWFFEGDDEASGPGLTGIQLAPTDGGVRVGLGGRF